MLNFTETQREREEDSHWQGLTSRAVRANYFRAGVDQDATRPTIQIHRASDGAQILESNDKRLLLESGRHPAEAEFNETIDYSRRVRAVDEPLRGRGAFNSTGAQTLHRRYQTASQLHGSCHQTCFKYLKRWAQQLLCRFGFPVNLEKLTELNEDCATTATIVNDRDAKRRVRWRGLPPRNNAYVNNTPVYVINAFLTLHLTVCENGNSNHSY
jgi:hypothetical protein